MIYLTNNVGKLSAGILPEATRRKHFKKDYSRGSRAAAAKTHGKMLKIEPMFNSIQVVALEGDTREIRLRDENRLLNDLKSSYGIEYKAPLLASGGELTVRWEARRLSSTAPAVIEKAVKDMSAPGLRVPSDLTKHIQEIPELRMPILLVSQQVIYPEREAELAGEAGFTNWYLEEL